MRMILEYELLCPDGQRGSVEYFFDDENPCTAEEMGIINMLNQTLATDGTMEIDLFGLRYDGVRVVSCRLANRELADA